MSALIRALASTQQSSEQKMWLVMSNDEILQHIFSFVYHLFFNHSVDKFTWQKLQIYTSDSSIEPIAHNDVFIFILGISKSDPLCELKSELLSQLGLPAWVNDYLCITCTILALMSFTVFTNKEQKLSPFNQNVWLSGLSTDLLMSNHILTLKKFFTSQFPKIVFPINCNIYISKWQIKVIWLYM